ncbi:MAG: C_GCAxxG_C_C family protein [Gammaproteobacteria bacterium]|nr:C_GCAxxG_C_C family protein [Gammaproteobacteria bacterium]
MVMAVTDNLGKGQSEELAAMASGLCGGMGGYKATCGVFTGGAMAISLLSSQGRLPEGKKTRELSARFHQQLLAHAGGQICEELLEDMGSIRNINKRLCRKLTRDGAEILGRVIVETESGGS